jgi:hypothetical protein
MEDRGRQKELGAGYIGFRKEHKNALILGFGEA